MQVKSGHRYENDDVVKFNSIVIFYYCVHVHACDPSVVSFVFTDSLCSSSLYGRPFGAT